MGSTSTRTSLPARVIADRRQGHHGVGSLPPIPAMGEMPHEGDGLTRATSSRTRVEFCKRLQTKTLYRLRVWPRTCSLPLVPFPITVIIQKNEDSVPCDSRLKSRNIGVTRLVIAAVAMLTASSLQAQTTPADTLTVDQAVTLARTANPMLQAMRLRADAAAQRIPQAGAWQNPQLGLALRNRPLDGFGTDQPMTMNMIELGQQIPWPGKLGYAKERAEQLADADSLDADEVEAQLTARVKAAYYQLAFADRAIAIMDETRDLLRSFLEVSSTMYQVGTGLQQDVLQAQVAVAQMTEDITIVEQRRIAMAARLNALLGRGATVLIPGLQLPTTQEALPTVEALMAAAEAFRPALAAARARAEAAEAGYRASRRQLYPDFMVRVGYGQRPQFTDMLTLAVGVSIPLFAGSRQLPLRAEMLAMQAMEEARERDLYNETFARVAELRAEAERARSLTSLYINAVLPQARAAVESAFSAYRVGQVDYMTLVQNQMTVNRYEIESVRLAADYQRALAELQALVQPAAGSDR